MNIQNSKYRALLIINSFPRSKNGQPYLMLKNKRKLFFNKFIHKYGLEGVENRYKDSDLKRRLACVEFFPYFVSEFDLLPTSKKGRLQFESHFHRMIIVEIKIRDSKKLELLSFYPL